MRRKTLFWILFPMLLLAYAILLVAAILTQEILMLGIALPFLFLSAYALYRLTYKQRPKYPMIPPDGKPDAYYRYGIPRPIYEDTRRYPWFFRKRKKKSTERTKRIEKKS
jgi:hypothetical protein